MRSLSVVIPAYNEGQRIRTHVQSVLSFLDKQKRTYEVIVVDDGSSDNTFSELSAITHNRLRVLRNDVNHGKGYSVKRGVLASHYDHVLFSDADLSTPFKELVHLERFLPSFDVVIGSRAVKGAQIMTSQPFYRVFIGKCFNVLVQLLGVFGIHDTQCGFKLFKGDVARKIFRKQTIDRWAFDVEILFIAKKNNYLIKEFPVEWAHSGKSEVHALRDSLRMFKELLVIRWNALCGKYRL